MDFVKHFLEATTVAVMMIAILIMIIVDPIVVGTAIIIAGAVMTVKIKKGESRRA